MYLPGKLYLTSEGVEARYKLDLIKSHGLLQNSLTNWTELSSKLYITSKGIEAELIASPGLFTDIISRIGQINLISPIFRCQYFHIFIFYSPIFSLMYFTDSNLIDSLQ